MDSFTLGVFLASTHFPIQFLAGSITIIFLDPGSSSLTYLGHASLVPVPRETFINRITLLKLFNGLPSLWRWNTNHLALSSPQTGPSSPGFVRTCWLYLSFVASSLGTAFPLATLHLQLGVSLNIPLLGLPLRISRPESALLRFLSSLLFPHYNGIELYSEYRFHCVSPKKTDVLFTGMSPTSSVTLGT